MRRRRKLILAAGLSAWAGVCAAQDAQTLIERARVQKDAQDYAGAERSLESALKLQPRDADAQEELGFVYDELDATAKAVAVFERALAARPGDYAMRVRLGEDYARLGRMGDSRAQFTRARKIAPKAADAYVAEGYVDIGNLDDARADADFAALIAADGGNPAGYLHLGSNLSRQGDLAAAEKDLRKAVELLEAGRGRRHDLFDAIQNLGLVVQQEGRLKEAKAIFERGLALAREPEDRAVFLRALARSERAQNHGPQAEALFKEAIDGYGPGGATGDVAADVDTSLAELYLSEGRKAEAESSLDRAWGIIMAAGRISPDRYDYQTGIVFRIGQGFEKCGVIGKAEDAYRFIVSRRQVMRSEPPLRWAEAHLAGLYSAQGRKTEADELMREATGGHR